MKVKASFTIEASFLVPISFVIMLLIGYTSLWLYDRNIAWMNAADITQYVATVKESDEENAKEKSKQYINKHQNVFFLGDATFACEMKDEKLLVKAMEKGSVNIPFQGWMRKYGGPSFGQIEESQSKVVLKHCDMIRAYRRIKSVVDTEGEE